MRFKLTTTTLSCSKPPPPTCQQLKHSFNDHHKQDFSLLAPTSANKVKKLFTLHQLSNYKFQTPLSILGATQENLEPTFFTQNLHYLELHHKQKDEILDSPCTPILELDQEHKR